MTGSYIIDVRVSDGGTNINPGTGGGGGSGLLGAGAGLSKLIGVTKIMMSLLKELLWVFKPVMNLLKAMARTLGMFLEPIAQLMFLLVKPLLDLIRPMALLFRAMMAPVMGMMREYSNIMSSQMASGDTVGAMQTGMDMVGLALGGFFISLADTVGTMLITVTGNLLSSFATGLIDMVALLISPVFAVIDTIFRTNLVDGLMESANELKTTVTTNFQEGITSATTALHDGTDTMMTGLLGIHQAKLDKLKETVMINFPPTTQFLEDTVMNTGNSMIGSADLLQAETSVALLEMNTQTTDYLGKTGYIPSKFALALGSMNDSMEDFADDCESIAARIKSAARAAEKEAKKIKVLGMTIATIE